MPILEAMACGCPVVASDSSSIPEAAGEAALFFSPGDVKTLEFHLRQVLTSESLRNELVSKGYQWASRFTWERSAERHIEVYRKVLTEFDRKGG